MSGHSLLLRFTKQHRAVELSCEGPGIQTDVGDMWRDQNEQQVQNVFKRFLFHYSKANSVGSIQHAAFPSLVPFSAPIDAPVTKTVSEEKEAAPAFEAPGSP
ncbi:uncharacterized protein LOC118366854 isoform X3 [Oncorhynchus keta]|uniref:uncharacterized protein LOC118366854 isoform X3 n=1 Tax=Oncorhynchus keta TaxID=8018 RepID=UPI0015FD8E36|nr:uncharacterized protein LOC118366854 isoform X3 [Oncorhynchus keta]